MSHAENRLKAVRGADARRGLAARGEARQKTAVVSALKQLLRLLVPAGWRRRVRFALGWRWLRGDYADWAAARAASAGYDQPGELARYAEAARAVEAGRGAWERDACVFAEPAVNEPLLAALRAVAARHGGALDVVDFGGALGSTWRQHRSALAELRTVRWRVVEQQATAEAGRTEFANDVLSFHDTLAEAAVEPRRQVLLISAVLQYLEEPHAVLAQAAAMGFGDIILDRLPLWDGGRDRLTKQHTPPELGGGTYPCWVFDEAKIAVSPGGRYALAAEWEGFDDLAVWVRYRGRWYTAKSS